MDVEIWYLFLAVKCLLIHKIRKWRVNFFKHFCASFYARNACTLSLWCVCACVSCAEVKEKGKEKRKSEMNGENLNFLFLFDVIFMHGICFQFILFLHLNGTTHLRWRWDECCSCVPQTMCSDQMIHLPKFIVCVTNVIEPFGCTEEDTWSFIRHFFHLFHWHKYFGCGWRCIFRACKRIMFNVYDYFVLLIFFYYYSEFRLRYGWSEAKRTNRKDSLNRFSFRYSNTFYLLLLLSNTHLSRLNNNKKKKTNEREIMHTKSHASLTLCCSNPFVRVRLDAYTEKGTTTMCDYCMGFTYALTHIHAIFKLIIEALAHAHTHTHAHTSAKKCYDFCFFCASYITGDNNSSGSSSGRNRTQPPSWYAQNENTH